MNKKRETCPNPCTDCSCRNGYCRALGREFGWVEIPLHGGARPGAGRKPQGKAKRSLTIRLSEPARARLADIKQDTGMSFSAILEQFLTP